MKNKTKNLFTRNRIASLVLLAIAILFPLVAGMFSAAEYYIYIGVFILIYIIAVSGYDILFGYCGQISLGHAGFFAIGAYGSAILNSQFGIDPFITTILAAIMAALIGALIAYPAAGLKVHFLSLATTAFGWIVYYLIRTSPGGITGDTIGYFPNSYAVFGIDLSNHVSFYFFALLMVVVFLVLKNCLINSKTGRAFIAIRENPVAANGMGINVRKYKIIAFAVSAFFTAFAGAMYGHFSKYINSDGFSYAQSNLISLMLLFGGKGTLFGPIIGSVFVNLLTEVSRMAVSYQPILYAAVLLLVVMFMSSGITSLNLSGIKKLFKKNKGDNNKEEVSEDVES